MFIVNLKSANQTINVFKLGHSAIKSHLHASPDNEIRKIPLTFGEVRIFSFS